MVLASFFMTILMLIFDRLGVDLGSVLGVIFGRFGALDQVDLVSPRTSCPECHLPTRAMAMSRSIWAMSLPNRGCQELPNRDQPRPRLTELTQAQSGPKPRSWMGGSYRAARTAVTGSRPALIWSHFAKCSKIWAAAAAGRLNGRVHTLPPIHDCGLGTD